MRPTFNSTQKLLLLIMDVLLLTELTCVIYFSSHTTGDFSAVFLKTYVPLFLITLVSFIYLVRRLRTKDDPQEDMQQSELSEGNA